MGLFVVIEVKRDFFSSNSEREKVSRACPVDIFFLAENSLEINHELEDECTYCYLCLQNCVPGAIQIRKTYQDWLDNPQL